MQGLEFWSGIYKVGIAENTLSLHAIGMNHDTGKVDEAVLALLWLTRFREKQDWPWRTWKGHDRDVMNRLHEKGFISNPHNRNKSVGFTVEGERQAEALFAKLFGKAE